jgi:signal transduction histidine kinase
MALLGRMATSLAHEIHNPLSAIRMHAQLLDPAQMPAGTEDFIPTLLAETARIESLVNQWMFLAKPEPPAMAVLSLEQLVTQCVKAHAPAAAHAGVTMETDIAPELTITGDRRRLGQAVTNALVNATQAMPRGGRIEISARKMDCEIALVFRDHGTGFSTEALARYRELFFTEKEGGMGIGLSVTAEILEAHRGRLGVANAAGGGGAEVTFYLPAETDL